MDKLISKVFFDRFSPEETLINLLCNYVVGNNVNEGELMDLVHSEKIDWDSVFELVRLNKLSVVLISSLENLESVDSLPNSVKEKLTKLELKIRFYSEKYRQQTQKIISDLLEEGVDFVLMKTYAFKYQSVIEQFGRVKADVDLLVPVNEFYKASRILFGNGYKYYKTHHNSRGSESLPFNLFYLPKSQEVFKKLIHCVELHTLIVDTFNFISLPEFNEELNRKITQELYMSARLVLWRNSKLKMFPPTQLLINSFLHIFFQHNLQGEYVYYEWAQVIREYGKDVDWDFMFAFIEKYGLSLFLIWFLNLFNDKYPSLLPKKIVKKIEKTKNNFRLLDKFVYLYLRHKTLYPTNFLRSGEREKEWSWAIINNNLSRVVYLKFRRRIANYFFH